MNRIHIILSMISLSLVSLAIPALAETHSQTSEAFKIFIIIHFIQQYKSVKANGYGLSTWTLTLRGKG
jgi:hypothetical protein